MNRFVDRRLLFECAVTHYATLNATAEQLDELDRLMHEMAESSDWSDYHQADEQFRHLVGTASGLGTAVDAYHDTLAELYEHFIPNPIEMLHKSNCHHVTLVAALRTGDGNEAVDIARKHVDVLHLTMFMGLAKGGAKARTSDG
ncbi:FadR/GntR family transcriptional regulator [Arthrobacter sp. UNC362MFTsu5.1]|uniref:FadR/GntR family transcriptional regulator n=1 Tax=Arthrobacter sp. UNC362MFTsu5.1 TaxID=1449044 RepID=UPI000A63E65C|nr:FCD domain-containing protein [Arthrobacter sp. UNC362MFTsu5.1]